MSDLVRPGGATVVEQVGAGVAAQEVQPNQRCHDDDHDDDVDDPSCDEQDHRQRSDRGGGHRQRQRTLPRLHQLFSFL
jgi:hypothetical protein